MNPSTVPGPSHGSSINFDVPVFDDQEAEIQQDEQERQHELRQLLTNAFDDDLSEDDAESQGSPNDSCTENQLPQGQGLAATWAAGEEWPSKQMAGGMYGGHATIGQHHMLIPATQPVHATQDSFSSDGMYGGRPHYPVPAQAPTHPDSSTPVEFSENQISYDLTNQSQAEESGMDSGSYDMMPSQPGGINHFAGFHANLQHHLHQHPHGLHYGGDYQDRAPPGGYHQHYYQLPDDLARAQVNRPQPLADPVREDMPDHKPPVNPELLENSARLQGTHLEHVIDNAETPQNHVPEPVSAEGSMDQYRVRYKGKTQVKSPSKGKPEADERKAPIPRNQPAGQASELLFMQDDFLHQEGNSEQKKMAQLEILYKAKGRKLDEVTEVLRAFKEESDREIRVLKHKLILVEDENKGMSSSLEQANKLLQDKQDTENSLRVKLTASESQVQSVQAEKEELMKKLQTTETSIESLNAQLTDYEMSDALVRARDQHDSVVAGIQQKHQEEVLRLKQQLDDATTQKLAKGDEVSSLKQQVLSLGRESEENQIRRAETINRLTRSLEESQQQCQQLLESGSGLELSQVKTQLQEAIAARTIADDIRATLQDELMELKEQVNMYESLSSLGVLPSGGSGAPIPLAFDESYQQLGINLQEYSDLKTPGGDRSGGSNVSGEETVKGLRSELEKCLRNYQSKRDKVVELQGELRMLRSSSAQTELGLEKAQKNNEELHIKVTKLEAELSEHKYTGVTSRDHGQQERDNQILKKEMQDLQTRLEKMIENEAKMTEVNQQLSQQMSQMVQEFDEDKRQAIEKTQDAYMQLLEDTKKGYHGDLQREFEEHRRQLQQETEELVSKLREELQASQHELVEVKELYVAACQEKDYVKQTVRQEMQQELVQKEQQLQERFEKDKESEIERVKTDYLEKETVAIETALQKLQKDHDEKFSRRLEEEIAQAKLAWMKEQNRTVQAEAAEQLTEATEKLGIESDQTSQTEEIASLHSQLEALRAELERMRAVPAVSAEDINKNAELCESLKSLQQELDQAQTERIASETQLMAARERWAEERQLLMQQKDVQRRQAVQDAREQAEKDYRQFLSEHQDTLNKALGSAHLQFTKEKEELQHKHQMEIQQLQEQMDEKIQVKIHQMLDKEKETLNREWQDRLGDIKKGFETEKLQLLESHSQTLQQSLEKAKADWNKDYQSQINQQQQLISKREQEQAGLIKSLEHKDELLKTASTQAEQKAAQARQELMSLHKEETAKLKADLQKTHQEQLFELQEKLHTESQDHSNRRATMSPEEKLALMEQLSGAKVQLEHLERKYNDELETLKTAVVEKDQQIQKVQEQLTEMSNRHCETSQENNQLLQQVSDYAKNVTRLEHHNKELVEVYKKAKQEQDQLIKSYKTQEENWDGKLKMLTQKYEETSLHAQQELMEQRDRLEHEHSVAMGKMKQRMMEMRKEHMVAMETSRKEYAAHLEKKKRNMDAEVKKLKHQLKQASSTRTRRTDTPTQTDFIKNLSEDASGEVRHKYMSAVNKIKADVLRHLTTSNQRAAETVRTEVIKERQTTAKRLRKYYMKCLEQALDKHLDRGQKHVLLQAVERALDNLPEQDSQNSSATSDTLSGTPVPFGSSTQEHNRSTAVTPLVDGWFSRGGFEKASSEAPLSARSRSSAQRSIAYSDIELPRSMPAGMSPLNLDDSRSVLSDYENVLKAPDISTGSISFSESSVSISGRKSQSVSVSLSRYPDISDINASSLPLGLIDTPDSARTDSLQRSDPHQTDRVQASTPAGASSVNHNNTQSLNHRPKLSKAAATGDGSKLQTVKQHCLSTDKLDVLGNESDQTWRRSERTQNGHSSKSLDYYWSPETREQTRENKGAKKNKPLLESAGGQHYAQASNDHNPGIKMNRKENGAKTQSEIMFSRSEVSQNMGEVPFNMAVSSLDTSHRSNRRRIQDQMPNQLHRPIAMVTRHTQAPSPAAPRLKKYY